MAIPRPLIRSHKAAVAVGVLLFVVAAYVLYDAYDRRGIDAPWPFSAILPF